MSAGGANPSSRPPVEHLKNAPVVEAVIELRGRAENPWNEPEITARLKERLPDYPEMQAVREFSFAMALSPELGLTTPSGAPGNPSDVWWGVRVKSKDGRHIATLTRDLFAFSRLKPYESWEQFTREALQTWQVHQAVAGVSNIVRIGVRFINRLDVPAATFSPADYFAGFSAPPVDLKQISFMHRSGFAAPDGPERVSVVRTVKPGPTSAPDQVAVLLDIDAYSDEAFAGTPDAIRVRLDRLRTLKNQVFFRSFTEKALALCR